MESIPTQTTSPPSRWTRLFLAVEIAALAVLIGAAYSNHFHNSFHFDDDHTIVNNAFIRDLRNIPRFFSDATTFSALPSNQSYRPLVSTSLALDYALGGSLDPFWFHLSGFVFLLVQTVLLGVVIYGMLNRQEWRGTNAAIAAACAGLFALHPANADTVNYIIARSDVLSTIAVLASLACYQYFGPSRVAGIFSLPAALGVLAKPPAAMLAPLFGIYLWLFPNDEERRGGRRFLSWVVTVVPAFVWCGTAMAFVSRMTPKQWVAGAASNSQYLLTQPYVALLYLKTFFVPRGLSADYDLEAVSGTSDPRFWIGVSFVVLLVGTTILLCRSRTMRITGYGLAWFILALLPTSLLPLAELMNDHRTFFPYAGLMMSLAGVCQWMLGARVRSPVWLTATFVAVTLSCASAYATYQRNKDWKDEETLWLDVAQKSPRNGRGLMNYGNTQMAKGNFAVALDYFHRAQELAPNYPILMINLGVAEGATGHPLEAEQNFLRALSLSPGIPDAYTYYARWLTDQGRAAEAVPLLRKALELSPADMVAQDMLARALPLAAAPVQGTPEYWLDNSLRKYSERDYPGSITAARQALRLRPGWAEAWNNIGAALNSMGRYGEAAGSLKIALQLKPDFGLAQRNLDYAVQMQGRGGK